MAVTVTVTDADNNTATATATHTATATATHTATATATHTATATAAARELAGDAPVVTLATAHPAKFPDAVEQATGVRPDLPPFYTERLKARVREASRQGWRESLHSPQLAWAVAAFVAVAIDVPGPVGFLIVGLAAGALVILARVVVVAVAVGRGIGGRRLPGAELQRAGPGLPEHRAGLRLLGGRSQGLLFDGFQFFGF